MTDLPSVKIVFLFFLLVCLSAKMEAQPTDGLQPTLSQREMAEDLATLETHLLKIHPGLSLYDSSLAVPDLIEQLRQNLPQQATRIQFLELLAPIIDAVKCGHTGFDIDTGKKTLGLFQQDIDGLFPLQLKEVEGRILIRRNLSGDTLHIEDNMELLSIDRIPIGEVLEELSQINLGSDGDNHTGEVNFALKYFLLAYRMFYGPRSHFSVRVKDLTTGEETEQTLAAGKLKALRKIRLERYPGKGTPVIQLRKIEGLPRAALLDINSFTNDRFDYLQLGYRRRIKKIFKLIEKDSVDYLIVDLRDNPGGVVQNVLALMKYTYPEPFVVSKDVYINRQFFRSKAGLLKKIGMLFRKTAKKEDHIELRSFSGKRYRPRKRFRYDGNMIILLNEGSFSAACTYALFAKSTDRAILVGEEAGGSFHVVSAGLSHTCKLKNSGLSVRIPIMTFHYNVKEGKQSMLQGITPHIEKPTSVAQHLKGVDEPMNAAADLIRLHQQQPVKKGK